MTITDRIKALFQKRNYAISDVWETKLGQPVYSKISVQNAVKEGYSINPTVNRCVFLITKAVCGIPWVVQNEEGEDLYDHPLSVLMANPNPTISVDDMTELVTSWIELTGNAYLLKVKGGGYTTELWPISPDRLAPIPSKEMTEWVKGYSLDNSRRVDYEPEEIIHLKLFNPADPLIGISPLQAVSKWVDVDNDMTDFNKAAMQNRAVIDGILTFEREFTSQDQANAIAERVNETYGGPSNARRMKIIGSNAKYQRTALTPVELDFATSRKANREAIAMAFGVPIVYLGDTQASTYSNFQASELIFYIQTVIPLLDDMKDAYNFSFRDELNPGEYLNYDIMNVPAMREALFTKAQTAKIFHSMGVPMSEVNRIFEFGIEEYDGWDESHVSGSSNSQEGELRESVKKKPLRLVRDVLPLKTLNSRTR